MNQKQTQAVPRERLLSLDALRGFDMLWIIGGDAIIHSLAKTTDWGIFKALSVQMGHVDWQGFHFEDLIFPLFMFISGIAIPFALISKIEKGIPKSDMAKKAVIRGFSLLLIGWMYNGLFNNLFKDGSFIGEVRFSSVLGQIGMGYMFASLITIYSKTIKSRLFWLIGILTAIGLLQLLFPEPGSLLSKENCINARIDQLLMPGRLYGKVYDPEGLLCVISAISVTLMGTFAGYFLRDTKTTQMQKVKNLVITGASALVAALLLSTFYPFIKACWTSSFNILTAGIGFLLISLFYWVIDVKGWQNWSFFFRVIGMNAIFIYLFERVVDIDGNLFFGWTRIYGADINELILHLSQLAVFWGILYFLYKKKIFFRV